MALALTLTLAGCDLSMTQQRKLKTYASTTIWQDGTSARPLPPDTVAQGDVELAAEAKTPPPVTEALLARGANVSAFSARLVTALPATATASSSPTVFRRRRPIISIGWSRRRRNISSTL